MSNSIKNQGGEHIYYNVNIINPNNNVNLRTMASFTENRTQNLVDNADDYYLSVVRFYVPGDSIPLTVLPIKPYPNTNPNLTTLSVALRWNGFISGEIPIVYVPETAFTIPPPAPTQQNPNVPIVPYYYIYSYQNVLDQVNTALTLALIDLKAAAGDPPELTTTEPPYFSFTAATGLLSVNGQQSFYDSSQATPIQILGNIPFVKYFSNFPVYTVPNVFSPIVPGGLQFTYQYLMRNNGQNVDASGILHMSEEYISVGNWNIFRSLVFVSGTLPLQSEQIASSNGSGVSIGRQILTDFEPLVNDAAGQSRSIFQYYPQGPYRLMNFNSKGPINKFDVSIYWQSIYGDLYPVYIEYNEVATIKFLFVKKTAYTVT